MGKVTATNAGSGSGSSRRNEPYNATPRNNTNNPNDDDDDPFDEEHKDISKQRAPIKPSDIDQDDDEFDRQFYLADDDEYLHNADDQAAAGSRCRS